MSNEPPSSIPPPPGAGDIPPPPGYSDQGFGGYPSAPPPPPGYPPAYGGVPGLPPGVVLTSKGRRFGAYLLDALLLIVTCFIGWLVWYIILWAKGQSPAKSILKMRVYSLEHGRGASWGEMVMRELVGKIVLGFVPLYSIIAPAFVLWDPQQQAIWDKLAKTVVIDDPDGRFAPPGA